MPRMKFEKRHYLLWILRLEEYDNMEYKVLDKVIKVDQKRPISTDEKEKSRLKTGN